VYKRQLLHENLVVFDEFESVTIDLPFENIHGINNNQYLIGSDASQLFIYDLETMTKIHDLPISTMQHYYDQLPMPFGNGVILYQNYDGSDILNCMDLENKQVLWSVPIDDRIIATKIKKDGVWVQFKEKGIKFYHLRTGIVLEDFNKEKMYYPYQFEMKDNCILVRDAKGTQVDTINIKNLEKLVQYCKPTPDVVSTYESGRCSVVVKPSPILEIYPQSQFANKYDCLDYYEKNNPKSSFVNVMNSTLILYKNVKENTVYTFFIKDVSDSESKFLKMMKDRGINLNKIIGKVDIYYVEVFEGKNVFQTTSHNKLIDLRTAYPNDILVSQVNGETRYGLNI
jgi:hypothetical protein